MREKTLGDQLLFDHEIERTTLRNNRNMRKMGIYVLVGTNVCKLKISLVALMMTTTNVK